jgi:hydrogenase maturation factor
VIDANGIALQVVKELQRQKLGNQITIHVVFGVAMLDDRQAVELDSSY